MSATFKQLPIDFLISTWKSKLPSVVGEAYAQMARIISERDLNLAILFSNAVIKSADTYTPTNVTPLRTFDATTATLDNVRHVLGTLIDSLQDSGIIK
jgi:hypothetical protein